MSVITQYTSKVLQFFLNLTSKQIVENVLYAKSLLVSDFESVYALDLFPNDQSCVKSWNSDWKRATGKQPGYYWRIREKFILSGVLPKFYLESQPIQVLAKQWKILNTKHGMIRLSSVHNRTQWRFVWVCYRLFVLNVWI